MTKPGKQQLNFPLTFFTCQKEKTVRRGGYWATRITAGICIYAVLMLLFGWEGIYYRFASPPEHVNFTGSETCGSCHEEAHTAWFDSLHRKMMRPIRAVGADIAAFHDDDQPSGLSIDDVAWVIGSKWEQQFMGHDGEGETLLPGAWMVNKASWKKTSWDGWSEPNPLQRCHGCHTVGLELETGAFVEPGIGCESCHGAGDWHVESRGRADIYASLDAEQCGQCHVRGRAANGAAFFPIEYKPGTSLEAVYTAWEPDYIQNSSAWWGNGRERKRHQQYSAWIKGGHVNSLRSLTENYDGQFGEVTKDCYACHSAEFAVYEPDTLSIEDAQNGITCSVCHQVHGELESPRVTCQQCHDNGPLHHETLAMSSHVPCPSSANVGCVDCHMPQTIKIGGEYQLHSHHPGIVHPKETIEFGVPNSCASAGCHSDDSTEAMANKYDAFYESTLLTGSVGEREAAP